VSATPIGLYVHIPFCHRKCGYCDFNTYVMAGAIVDAYLTALHQEIEAAPYDGEPVISVYFGGGTPTFLSGKQLSAILQHLCQRFQLLPDAEITAEANPGSVDQQKLQQMREAGFNRLSLGAQSFDPEELKRMDRIHSPEEIYTAVEMARAAGFQNLNLDLIFALPEQTLQRWEANLRQAIALQPEHLSLYALMLEPNTRFYHLYQKGLLTLPDEETQVEMYRLAQSLTYQAGYEQYEISNFARLDAGKETTLQERSVGTKSPYRCRHNLLYWHNQPYLGFGAGAASYYRGVRWTNVKHPREYVRRLQMGEQLAFESERLEGWAQVAETLMLGLRLKDGVDLGELDARYQLAVAEQFLPLFTRLEERGWISVSGLQVRPTDEGLLWHSEISLQILELSERCPLPTP